MGRMLCFPLLFVFCALLAGAQQFDRPVKEIRVSDGGAYRAVFMHSSIVHTLFDQPSDLVLLGEVISTAEEEEDNAEFGMRTSRKLGRLRISRVVLCPVALAEAAAKIRVLESDDGFYGLAVGDTVLVFMVPYEGAYAIPNWRDTNTPIGHKLDHSEETSWCDDRRFVELLSTGRAWNLESLTSDEMRLWKCIDAEGLLEALIRSRELSPVDKPR